MAKGTKSYSAAAQTHVMAADGRERAKITVSGTFVGTIVFETSEDNGATWQAAAALNTAGAVVTSATAPGTFRVFALPKTPGTQIRTRCSAYTSGTPVVDIEHD